MQDRLARTKAMRADRIVEAAKMLFITQGYDAVTMGMVAAEASMSKVTIYKYYPTKQELLLKVATDWMEKANDTIWPDNLDESVAFDVFLTRLMRNFYDVFLTMDATSARQMILGAMPKFPELGRIVFEHGPGVVLRKLEEYFKRMTDAGRAGIEKPRIAAAQFYSLMQSDVELHGVFLSGLPSVQDMKAKTIASVEMFTGYYGARQNADADVRR